MSPYVLFIMLSSLALGTMLTFTSSHWLLAWMSLEINTLAIIPLMIKHHHPRATEATTKYFLTQATASTLILFSTMMNAWTTGQWGLKEMSTLPSNMMTIAFMMKLGIAPLHFWLPEVIQGLDLTTGMILSTWQKLAPMVLIYLIHTTLNSHLMMLFGLLSILIGGWSGLNQTQLRKIMAFSSISHLGWMMVVLTLCPPIFLFNLSVYLILTLSMFLTFKYLNTTKLNSMASLWSKTPVLTAFSTITLLSLGGLPPTTGFTPKWLILHELTKNNLSTLATIMAISALLSLFFYLRLCYSLTPTQSPNLNNSTTTWRYKSTQPTMLISISTILSLTLLPLTPLMIYM
uniref:NADH-ubiquinone oxidoreductase chain 2 n=1 Tax=Gegeneophis ramaswamii TaxID=194526 RepID=Q64JU6_GEGRA|nr:NADH dehydrogenase subunit 2 [Gegeneophis ramaswamii]AAS13693.1 NADH dehydrogenase subunit 2 [Gegeneophis ramaswamii]